MAYRMGNKKARKEIEHSVEGRRQDVSNLEVWCDGDKQHPKIVEVEKCT